MIYLPPRDRDGRPANRPNLKTPKKPTAKERFVSYWKARGAFTDAMIDEFWAEALAQREQANRAAKERTAQLLAKKASRNQRPSAAARRRNRR